MERSIDNDSAVWLGADARRSWRQTGLVRMLVALFIPPRGQKVIPTKAGVVVIVVALGIGMAAYNTSSNILFIALSLILSTIIVSGLLSWLNFRRTAWRVRLQPPFRAGQTAVVGLEIFNGKRVLPTYSLGFDFQTSGGEAARLVLPARLDPGATQLMEWTFRPARRGRELVEMSGVSSQFPFGFLQKHFGGRIAHEVYVWPERVPYESELAPLPASQSIGDVLNRAGAGNDFVNLRRYEIGDSVRQVHWKATARHRRLMVRQLLAENHSGFFLHVESVSAIWSRSFQFEKLCSLAGSLAEDLFRQGQLIGGVINDGPPLLIRRLADLDLFLDQLAVLETIDGPRVQRALPTRNIITFEPAMPDGVHALVHGEKAASA